MLFFPPQKIEQVTFLSSAKNLKPKNNLVIKSLPSLNDLAHVPTAKPAVQHKAQHESPIQEAG